MGRFFELSSMLTTKHEAGFNISDWKNMIQRFFRFAQNDSMEK